MIRFWEVTSPSKVITIDELPFDYASQRQRRTPRLRTHEALPGGGIHGQIGGDEGENALRIASWDREGDHPNLTSTRIKVRGRPNTRVRGQWRCNPDLSLNVVGGRGEVVGGVAVGGAIDVGGRW